MVTLRETPEDMLGRVTRMRAKDFLYRARGVEYEIRALKESEREAWDRATRITQNYDGDGATATKDPHKFDFIMEYIDTLVKLEAQLSAIRQEVVDTIYRLPNRNERLVLKAYYVDFKTWERTACDLHFSYRQVMRIHAKALKHIEEFLTCH